MDVTEVETRAGICAIKGTIDGEPVVWIGNVLQMGYWPEEMGAVDFQELKRHRASEENAVAADDFTIPH